MLAQRNTVRHTYVHGLMLVAGMRRGDWREVIGQVPRMDAWVLFSRLWVPRRNTGRARVSAFEPMPVPQDCVTWCGKSDPWIAPAPHLALDAGLLVKRHQLGD